MTPPTRSSRADSRLRQVDKPDSTTQAWLLAHYGEAVAPEVLSRIVTAGGSVNSRGWWIGSSGADGFYLSDKAINWIELKPNED